MRVSTAIGGIHVGDVIVQIIFLLVLLLITVLIVRFIRSFFQGRKDLQSQLNRMEEKIDSIKNKK